MRCGGGRRVVTASVAAAAPFCLRRTPSTRAGAHPAGIPHRRCVSTDGRATAAALDAAPHALLQQLRRRFLRDAPGASDAPAAVLEEEGAAAAAAGPRQRAPSLQQIIAGCEAMCDAERPVASSAAEWSEAVQLLLCAMARAGRGTAEDGVTPRAASTPWCVALRLFLHPPPAQSGAGAETPSAHPPASAVSLLRCCVRHGAPLLVGRAVYQTLRSSAPVAAGAPVTGWHVPYARFLLLKAAEAEAGPAASLALHKEALRVLLLDAAEDGEMLHPAGLLLSLEVLRRLVAWSDAGGEESSARHNVRAVEDALWSRLQRGTDTVAVARDVCCCVLRNRHAAHAVKREAFCRFIAVGMRLPLAELQPFLCSAHHDDGPAISHGTVTPSFFLQTLQAVTGLLGGDAADAEAVARVLAEPSDGVTPSGPSAAPCFASVWLVDHVLQGLASLRRQAITAGGAKESRRCAVEAWVECTRAALRSLQRVLLHLPDARRWSPRRRHRERQHARQQAFCMVFRAARNGVFHSLCAECESPAPAPPQPSDVISTLTQVYGEQDWRWPSADLCIECLHAWRRHDVLRRVFCEVQRRDERRWHGGGGPVDDQSTPPHRWRSSLRLSTCCVVVQSACQHDDPATAALAVRHILLCLLAARSSEGRAPDVDDAAAREAEGAQASFPAEGGGALEGQSVAAWTRLLRDDVIPRVDEVFCRTGTDTAQRWLGELEVGDPAAPPVEAVPAGCEFERAEQGEPR
ncbi:uncharacterized protein Tco025E_04676 [Trypanosoma conorhini]|uniref:Uncharacterized protein n=1 Tax=Trypanosoma conorhini TaxID=83891 RepID=A0A422PJZ0_9TRYP|nr:uncharacterized protein Tco025E_04676 [Trypanosoma conorhini]RNF18017.1 hypothetical protein Tco025E_04676 [Trypanosoma conorhini]